jgi:REP element-mobilizing transposase RayT
MKSDLSIIIPDILAEYSCVVERLTIKSDRIYIHFTASPQHSPAEIGRAVVTHGSIRLKRLHEKLDGFKEVFREDYYFKSGKKPTRAQVEDFITIVKKGI